MRNGGVPDANWLNIASETGQSCRSDVAGGAQLRRPGGQGLSEIFRDCKASTLAARDIASGAYRILC
jgi:hypothetical protein